MISESSITASPFNPSATLVDIVLSSSPETTPGSIDQITKLLESGFPIDTPDDDGRTALFHATACANPELIQTLLEFGANPNIQDLEGMTPFHMACCNSPVASINQLLKNGSFLFSQDNAGDTGLHWAIREARDPIVVQSLVAADPLIVLAKNADGESPIDFASDFGEQQILAMLTKTAASLVREAEHDVALHKILQDSQVVDGRKFGRIQFEQTGLSLLQSSAELISS